MDITRAVKEIESSGGRAHRAAWDRKAALYLNEHGAPIYCNGAGEESPYNPSWADIMADDWFIEITGESDDPTDVYRALELFAERHRRPMRSCDQCMNNQGGICLYGYDLSRGGVSHCELFKKKYYYDRIPEDRR